MNLPPPFKTFRITRFHMMRELEGLTDEQMVYIPEGREDNILWNVGHLLCSISRLTYVFSGHPLPIPEGYLALFGKDTSARDWKESPDVQTVVDRFVELAKQIEFDYQNDIFKVYKALQIVPEDNIASVEEAIAFHCFHEGLHIGKILTLKEAMGLPVKGG